jgi:hypothetical protein
MLSLIFLSGCAFLNKKDCERANWQKLGIKDGEKGRSEYILTEYKKSCSKYGIIPDEKLYKKGRTTGLEEFCDEQTGFHMGTSRRDYPNVCPEDLKPYFDKGYKRGLERAKTLSERRSRKKRKS